VAKNSFSREKFHKSDPAATFCGHSQLDLNLVILVFIHKGIFFQVDFLSVRTSVAFLGFSKVYLQKSPN
jgi:hypothetical protein